MFELNELWIGEIPATKLAGIESLLASFGAPFSVDRRSNSRYFTICSNHALSDELRANLASSLSKTDCPFELTHIGLRSERYLFIPSLGIHRIELSEAGEEVLSAGRILALIEEAKGSQVEFRSVLSSALGEPWLHAIDLIRKRSERRVA